LKGGRVTGNDKILIYCAGMAILSAIGILELTGTIEWIYNVVIGTWSVFSIIFVAWSLGGLLYLLAVKN
jgi:hypothetical protein